MYLMRSQVAGRREFAGIPDAVRVAFRSLSGHAQNSFSLSLIIALAATYMHPQFPLFLLAKTAAGCVAI